ncbi:MAG: phage/plasmid primase, P4 family [Candidatus Pacearchaeota archaeon]
MKKSDWEKEKEEVKKEWQKEKEQFLKKEGNEDQKIVLMSKFSPEPYVESLLKKTKFVYDKYKTLWRFDYTEGIWRSDADQWVRTELRKNLMGEGQQKKQYVEEVVSFIKDYYFDENFEPNKNPYLIAFKNKIYNLKNNRYLDFSPDYSITSKLDLMIDENNTFCPEIDQFFEDSIGKEYKSILYDLCAYCLFKGYPYQKAFFIYGPASTGKSVFMEFLEKFLGQENFCSIEPKQIQKDKHASYKMWQMLANVVSDIDYRELEDVTVLKKITGGDTLFMRPMYSTGFNVHTFAKQIFSTNKLPAVREKTMAWYRRAYIIPFMNRVDSEKRDPFLISKITQKEEMEAFAYQCLKSLRNMYKRNWKFTYDVDVEKMAEVYEKLSNPIQMFINENCVEESLYDSNDGFVYKWEFRDKLNQWLKNNHLPTASSSEVNSFMRERYTESNRKAPFKEKYYRVWAGLNWIKSSHNHNPSFNQFNLFNGKIKKVLYMEKIFDTPLNWLYPLKRQDLANPLSYHQKFVELIKNWEQGNTKNDN